MTSADLRLPEPRTPDPADAPPLRWGILAPGGIAASFVHALGEHTAQQVVAVGSRDRARAEQFAARFGIERAHDSYEALVGDDGVDIVYVASPHSHHHEHALLAIAAGRHVLVEKAFTATAQQGREVIAAAQDAGVLALEAMWTRFLPHVDVVRQLLADGALGDVRTVIADHGQWFAPDAEHRLFAPSLAGGALLDLGVYPISFASFVLGTPRAVHAVGTPAFTGVDGQVSLVLDHGEAHALIDTTLFARTPTTASVSGTAARVEIPGDFYTPRPVTLIARDGARGTWDGNRIHGHEGLCFQAAHAARLVHDGATESPLLPAAETLAILDTMDEVRRQIGTR